MGHKGKDDISQRAIDNYNRSLYANASSSGSRPLTAAHGNARPPILFQVPNHIGLGHMNRAAAIAIAIRKLMPDQQVMFAVEGTTHGLLEQYHLPYVSIPRPGAFKISMGNEIRARKMEKDLGRGIANAALKNIAPALVVYDCFPNPHFVNAAIALKIPTLFCLRNLRDIETFAQRAVVAKALESCHSLLVPHAQEDSTVPAAFADKAVYVGEIVRDIGEAPLPLHLRFKTPSNRTVIITAGGGGHETACHFINTCIRAVEIVRRSHPEILAVVIPGPLFERWAELEAVPCIKFIPFSAQLAEICADADMVLAQAGYNTLNELASIGTTVITIPAERTFDDQYKRAESFAARCNNIHVGSLEQFEVLCAQIEHLLAQKAPRTRQPPPSGALHAAVFVKRLIESL